MNFKADILSSFLSRPKIEQLPSRVREAIRQREWSNEVLLRIIQLLIVCMFCFIYAISPKTSPSGAFSPVPYVLIAYLALSLFGLAWGLRREPPDWASFISILFDFALLYGLMISFHIQYMQPASFIMKAPALLYVFIFISIRALRFHPKFVLAAGLTAATGWVVMILYVTRIDPGDNMLTRSYVQYLTSNSILIGAEFDKIISILMVTGVLALAVNGSNNMLVTAISEQTAAQDLSRFFDHSVAGTIRSGTGPLAAGTGEKQEATIVNIDIRGFTLLAARMDASEVVALLSSYQERIIPILQSHGGVIDKFMGDGIMANFGIGSHRESHAANALAAAEAILAEADRWAVDPSSSHLRDIRIGIGIASGTVVWGAVGGNGRLEMTVIGSAVNLSAKLEKQNKILDTRLIAQRDCWQLACDQGYHGELQPRHVAGRIEGVGEPLEIVILDVARRAVSDKVPADYPMPSNSAEER
ncbi:MAG: adenylate/guanylate cyclase domain-containing protein [Rhizobiaceae bacterium]